MGVRSKPLGGTVDPSTTGTLFYTVASGETTILKSIVFSNRHATNSVTISVYRGTTATPNAQRLMFKETIAAGDCKRVDCWIVLAAENGLVAKASTGSAANLYCSGAELEGVAD